ncbi:hypothetical protein AVEN_136344-1 [Araneus ventricosus]|uniref:Uncharacterized protein n=1 Tax=Araneus ventricosus TaxID=182803 RepID=A0A4Y2E1S1_ARAVE|nr:hypothetical protein AVEN_136344-1 [Araneus ventricosus]
MKAKARRCLVDIDPQRSREYTEIYKAITPATSVKYSFENGLYFVTVAFLMARVYELFKVRLTSRFEATRGLFRDGPRNFESWLSWRSLSKSHQREDDWPLRMI